MKHLSIERCVSQYFVLILVLVLFHSSLIYEVIPRISSLLKARKVIEGNRIWLGEGSEDLFTQLAIEYSKLKIKYGSI